MITIKNNSANGNYHGRISSSPAMYVPAVFSDSGSVKPSGRGSGKGSGKASGKGSGGRSAVASKGCRG